MIRWDILVPYGQKTFNLMAEVENRTGNTMRIRIYGMKGTIVLRNNYPGLHATQSSKPMVWALVEGNLDDTNPRTAKLLADIIQQLEPIIRNKFPMNTPLL